MSMGTRQRNTFTDAGRVSIPHSGGRKQPFPARTGRNLGTRRACRRTTGRFQPGREWATGIPPKLPRLPRALESPRMLPYCVPQGTIDRRPQPPGASDKTWLGIFLHAGNTPPPTNRWSDTPTQRSAGAIIRKHGIKKLRSIRPLPIPPENPESIGMGETKARVGIIGQLPAFNSFLMIAKRQ